MEMATMRFKEVFFAALAKCNQLTLNERITVFIGLVSLLVASLGLINALTTKDSQKAIDQIGRLADITSLASFQSNRAYISPDLINLQIDAIGPQANLHINNTGHSPATNVFVDPAFFYDHACWSKRSRIGKSYLSTCLQAQE